MEEVWKEVVGAPRYRVSNLGNVFGLIRGKQLKPFLGGKRRFYYQVYITYSNGYRTAKNVHSLVIQAFVGERPDGMECRHLNGNPLDNRLENLKWGTSKENSDDIALHGRKRGRPPKCKITAEPQAV